MSKLKKIFISAMAMIIAVTSSSANVFAKIEETVLRPGEVAQNKTATWSDYANGIAEISFDVVGKSAEEPVDVVILYDNSGSMQLSEKFYGEYLTSRWYYAAEAAKTFSDSLLENKNNNIAFIPFSDVLIDGDSLHSNPSDFFETHDFIYDKDGNSDIQKMISFSSLYEGYITGKSGISESEFYEYCESYLALTKAEVDEIINSEETGKNTQNAVVSFTKDRENINKAIDSLYPSHAGETNYETALNKAQELFDNSNNADRNKVIVMISDGKPNKGGDSVAIANQLKDSGVTIYTCGTGISDSDASTLKRIASVENNAPLYCSSKPSDLDEALDKIRKEIGIAAEQAVIEDEINSEYFEYFIDETHYPTVDGVKITDEEIIVSEDKDLITWKIGNINEEKKTLKFYVKIKDSLLNEDLLSKDQSILNKSGDYYTNKNANLTYKEVDTGDDVTSGHEMQSPSISISTATMKQTYYLSDANGNYIEKVVLWEETSNNKALNIEYTIAPKASIEVDGVKYFILKEDNKETKKTFTNNDTNGLFTYRYVKQLNVTFDANEFGQFNDNSVTKSEEVNHKTMTVNSLPEVTKTNPGTHFIGWNTDKNGNGETFDTSYIIKNNMTVYAQYRHDSLNVIFQDENNNVYDEQTVEYGTSAKAPTVPNREGYTFVGWDKDFSNVTTNLVVTSQFQANKYAVTFDGNGATSGTMRDQEFTYDVAQNLNKNVYERENHTFVGWLYDGKTYTDEAEVKNLIAAANGNITFVAQWREDNKYTVIFQDDAGNLLQQSTVYEGEDAIAPVAPSRDGYTFVGWDKGFTNVRGNLVVTAIYEENVVTIIPPTINPPTIIPGQPTLPTETPIAPIVVPPVQTVPVVANPPAVLEQPETPVQGEQTVTPPVANEEIIEDQEVPLGTIGNSWALVNLICTIVVTVLGIFLLLAKRKKEEDEESAEAHKRRVWTKVATVVVTIVTIVAFIITEDVTLPMVLTDKWTIAMLILTLVQIVVVCVGRKWKEDKEQQKNQTA